MKLSIAVLAGDGIGPEISREGVAVMQAVCSKFGHEVTFTSALCGAAAIDAVGNPFPPETLAICQQADAVLFSAVGDPRFDNNPNAPVRPEQGLLAMRKQLGLPEQGKTDPASLTPELRKMAEEAEAEARRAGEARAAQARTAARPAAAGGIPGGGRRNIVRL